MRKKPASNPLLPPLRGSKRKRRVAKKPALDLAASDWENKPSLLDHRLYQRAVFMKWKQAKAGLMALVWRRQGGKTTTLAELAVLQMLHNPGRLVTFASVSLLCGRELVYKESQVFLRVFAKLRQKAAEKNCRLEIYDSKTGKPFLECGGLPPLSPLATCREPSTASLSSSVRSDLFIENDTKQGTSSVGAACVTLSPPLPVTVEGVSLDTFAELYESQRLEFRLDHGKDKGVSRTLIIAPNPATARGWTGDVMIDEIGFIKDLREVWEAMEPIVSSDKTFRVIMSTTPPDDDAHFAFELLAPDLKVGRAVPGEPEDRPVTEDGVLGTACPTSSPCHPFTLSPLHEAAQPEASPYPGAFSVNPEGNWYRSAAGILVHRCDIYDAAAAGAPVLDLETREALTPEQHFARALDKEAWRRNYGLQFLAGGASAVPLAELAHAQAAGQGEALFLQVENVDDLQTGLNFLRAHLGHGPVGVGWDLATTERMTSNPSALAVMERVGEKFVARLVLAWKTSDAQEAANRVQAVLECIAERPEGGTARRLCIDATNEKYYSNDVQKQFAGGVLVEPVAGSALTKVPGEKEPISFKVLLGHELLNALAGGRLALPPERYIKEDFRLVKRNRGTFETELSAQGMHGDTFEACKLALRAVTVCAPGPMAMVA